jgi:hypothetical protein
VVDVCEETFRMLDQLLSLVCEGVSGNLDWPPPQDKECMAVACLNLLKLQVNVDQQGKSWAHQWLWCFVAIIYSMVSGSQSTVLPLQQQHVAFLKIPVVVNYMVSECCRVWTVVSLVLCGSCCTDQSIRI